MGRHAGHRREDVAHREVREIGEGQAPLERLELTPRGHLQVTVEVGRSADDEDLPRLRLKPERDIEGGAVDAICEKPCHADRERDTRDIVGVGPTEHDRNAGSNRVGVSQQKSRRRSHDADDEIQFSAAVLFRVVVTQHELMLLPGELGGIHRLREELDIGVKPIAQRRTERLVEECQAGESLVLVEQQEDTLVVALVGRQGRSCAQCSDHAQANDEGQVQATANRSPRTHAGTLTRSRLGQFCFNDLGICLPGNVDWRWAHPTCTVDDSSDSRSPPPRFSLLARRSSPSRLNPAGARGDRS